MKLLAVLSLAALTLAQSTSTQTQTQTAVVTLSPAEQCIKGCSPADVNCQAACVGVPHPGNAQMNDTTSCVAACDQGDGSAQASNAYAACRNACISSYIITSGTAAPGGAYSTAGQTPAASAAGPSSTASSGNASATAASKSSAGAATVPTPVRMAVVGGSLGLVFAAFALL